MNEYIKGNSPNWKDLTGQKFSRLLVLGFLPTKEWRCLCDCGNQIDLKANKFKTGNTQSCGCYRKENIAPITTTHGKSGTKLYKIWVSMKHRCYSEKDKSYKHYGGRGIKVCDSWKNSVENFLKDMGPCPENHTLDRKDVDGDYSPDNCRWADAKTQANNRRNNIIVKKEGKIQTLIQYTRENGLNYKTILSRINDLGWNIEDAISTPIKRYKNQIPVTK